MSHSEDAPGAQTRTIRDVLLQDHHRLDSIFDELVDAARAGVDTKTLHSLWREFEQGLRAHLDTEETLLLPRVGHRYPAVRDRLLDEHRQIRELLDKLAVDVDLHTIREQDIEQMIDLLRAHSEQEDRTLYRWPEAMMRVRERRTLLDRLVARLRG